MPQSCNIDRKKVKNGQQILVIFYIKFDSDLRALTTVQWNPVYTDTKGTCQNVRIIRVSVLSGLFF